MISTAVRGPTFDDEWASQRVIPVHEAVCSFRSNRSEPDKITRFSRSKDGSGSIEVRLVKVALISFEQGSAVATAVAAAKVTASVAHLVSMKAIEGSGPALRKWTAITVMRIKTIIHVTEEAMWTMEPWADPDEYASAEPLGPVIPIWSAAIWSVIEVAVWANRLDADVNGDARRCRSWNS